MPTKLYFHDVANDLAGTFPASAIGQTATWAAGDAQTLKKMDLTIGVGQVSKVGTSSATTGVQWGLVGRFVSPPLAAGSIGGTTLTSVVNFAAAETNLSMDYCEDVRLDMIVWRPSTGTNLGTLVTSASTYTGDVEPLSANSERVIQGRRTGVPSAITLQDGDVLMVEIWSRHQQAAATAYDGTVYYDGTTENLVANSVVTNHAGFLELTYTLNFLATGVTASAAITLGALTLSSTGEVNVTASAAATLGALTLASTANVNVTASAAVTLGALTLASTLAIGSPVTASAAFTLGALTLASTANVNVTASTAATLGALTLASTLTFAAASATASVAPAQVDPGAGSGAAQQRRKFQIPQEEPEGFSLDRLYRENPVEPPAAVDLSQRVVYTPLTVASALLAVPQPVPAPKAPPVVTVKPAEDDDDDFMLVLAYLI